MNILLRFEDKYGCSSLFKNYFPKYKECIEEGLSNSGVFTIESTFLANYDLIIFVYDLDSYGDGNLMLKKESFNDATDWMISYIDKIVFIPVFFCFETLVLFSLQLRKLINMPSRFMRGDTANILIRYKEQYDYSILIPEFLDNYAKK